MYSRMMYEPEQVLMAARFLEKYNNVSQNMIDRDVQEWYDNILSSAKLAVKNGNTYLATGGYIIVVDWDDSTAFVEVYVEPTLGVNEESVYQYLDIGE